MRRTLRSCAAIGALMLSASSAHALDLPKLFGKPLTTEITEVTIVAQRFDSREVDPITEGGAWGQWINRLNAKLDWNHFEVGFRLDSALYWNTLSQRLLVQQPAPNVQPQQGQCKDPNAAVPSAAVPPILCGADNANIARDDLSRYQNSIYLAKVWGSYKQKGIEIIVGDAYVQFARGLVLSMRKLDDLGIDTTVRGFKAAITRGPFAVTLVGGLANPARVDEASGQALFNEKSVPNTNPAFNNRGPQPIFGLDQIFGGEIQAGRDSPVVLTTSMSYVNRCAPNAYTGANTAVPGRVYYPDALSSIVGYCDDRNTAIWLAPLGGPATGFIRNERHVTTVGQAIEFPKMGRFGSLYVVGSIQHRDGYDATQDPGDFDSGTALYAAYTGSYKSVDGTLEFKDYRNFFPTAASVDGTQVSALSNIAYSAVPTIESITQDNMLGNFNVCVDGLRARVDWRLNKKFLVFAQGIFSISKGEQNAQCDRYGNLPSAGSAALTDYVADGLIGEQYEFEGTRSHIYATIGARQDSLGTGDTFIQQGEITYNFSKSIAKKVAIEFLGRHRVRYERGDNLGANGFAEAWVEGENYTGLSIAPKWIFTQGIEYTTRDLPANTTFLGVSGYPAWLFLSVGGTYKFTKDSNLRIFLGQQRGGLKCISGVCRIFPAFEGARAELTLRF